MFARMPKEQKTKHSAPNTICTLKREKIPDIPYIYAPVIQRVRIEEALPILYQLYLNSDARKQLGDLEDFFVFGYIASKCEKNHISALMDPKGYYEREVAPEIQKLASLFRFLGNAGVPFAVFEQLKFFVRNHIVEGRVDLSKVALDSIILDLKNYIKCLGNIREWICNEIQNESVDIEELYLYITKIVISEAQPLIVARDNIENEIRYVFEMYMQNKFLKDFPLWDVLKGNYPDYVKSICIRAMIMWRGEECLRQVIAYLITICNLLPAYIDKELTQLCGQYIMESVLEEIEQRVSNAGVDLSSYYKRDEQMIQQYSKIVSEVYIFFWQKLYVCSRTELLYERLEWFLQDSNFNTSLQEAKEIALRIMKGIEKDATEDDFKKAESIYNEIRKTAYLTIHNLTGMDLEGQNDDSPAYLYKAYFAPFAKHQRHVVEGVKYPRSLSGRSADERTASAIFSVFEARQNNTGGAFVHGKGPSDYYNLFCSLKKCASDLNDEQIADDLINIFEGRKSQLLERPECQMIVGKIMTIFCYAEAQRNPVALLEAYIALKKFRDDAREAGSNGSEHNLAAAFNAKYPNEYTPLFVPSKGAQMIRGDKMSGAAAATYRRILPFAVERMLHYFHNVEDIMQCMATIVHNLLTYTNASELYPVTPQMAESFMRQYESPEGMEAEERFQYINIISTGNNCAFDAVAAILQNSYQITVKEDFASKMRMYMGMQEGVMVELLGDGDQLLDALRYYFLIDLGWPLDQIPNFVLHAVINFTGELVDMQDIAHTDYPVGESAPLQVIELNLLYNGINHFDALLSGKAE